MTEGGQGLRRPCQPRVQPGARTAVRGPGNVAP